MRFLKCDNIKQCTGEEMCKIGPRSDGTERCIGSDDSSNLLIAKNGAIPVKRVQQEFSAVTFYVELAAVLSLGLLTLQVSVLCDTRWLVGSGRVFD
jgi:hypothetical protein